MKKILIALIIIGGLGTSCKKYLDKAYKNPNLPTFAEPELVLQSCISAMHRGIAFDARAVGFYLRNFSSLSGFYPPERHGYIPGSDAYGDIWRMHYWNMGFNIIDMIDYSKKNNKFDYVAAAYTLNAWSWLTAADYHGELPVTQAFEKGRLRFDYDDQKVAYELALKYTDSAAKYWALASTMTFPTLSVGDQYFFNGNITRWQRFNNGLKARLYHRWQKKPGYLSNQADSVLKYAALAMQSSADDASVKFNIAFPDVTSRNFFGPSRNNLGLFRPSQFFMSMLTGSVATPGSFGNTVNDPRVRYMFRPSPDGVYRGIATYRYADNPTTPTDQRVPSLWGTVAQTTAPALGVDTGARTFFRNDAPSMMMTYSEMQFLIAEVQFLKGNAAAAKTAYENGIRGHFDMLNNHYFGYLNTVGTNSPAPMTKVQIPAADIAAYLANPNFNPPTVTLSHIMRQKYISLWGWGFVESWVDMRRYEYDDVNIYPGYPKGSSIDLYPDNGGLLAERVRPRFNSENLWNVGPLNAVGGFNINYHTKKCWFSLP